MKSYNIQDIFKTSWLSPEGKQWFTPKEISMIIDFRQNIEEARLKNEHANVGHWSIMMLRVLRRNKNAVAKINVSQAVDCINDITFFNDPWFNFPVPGFTVNEKSFIPPDEYMHDRIFDQLVYADAAFSKFCVTEYNRSTNPALQPEKYVDELIAVIYCAPEKFDEKNLADDCHLVAGALKDFEKAVILHSYANIRAYIIDRCPNLFPKPPDTDHDVDIKPIYTGDKWLSLRYDLSETPAFQGLEVARKAYIYTAMDYLEKKAKEAIDLKSKLKANA